MTQPILFSINKGPDFVSIENNKININTSKVENGKYKAELKLES